MRRKKLEKMKGELVSMDTAGGMDQNPAAVYLASLSSGSRPTMRQALDVIADMVSSGRADAFSLPWGAMRYKHAAAIRAQLAERYAYSTANKMLSALRGVLKAAWRLGLMDAESYHTAVSVERVKGKRLPAGRHVTQGEFQALLDTCDQTMIGIRDAAMVSVLYGGGLRRAELVGLDFADFDQTAGLVKVRGKGNKERGVPLPVGTTAALGDWLKVRGDEPGPLFHGLGNRSDGGRLTTQAVFDMLKMRLGEAGIAPLSPHDFRRTLISNLLDAGVDIATVSQIVGHASVNTTARYDRRDEKTKREAADLLHVPYQKRVLGGG